MGTILEQCCNVAWEIIRGRKKIIGDKIRAVDQYHDTGKIEEYGWLSPDGNFHVVEFGNHQAWAANYLLELYCDGKITYEEARIKDNGNAGDILIDMGWILVHNPSRCNIKITKDDSRNITKRQKEFLFDFFCKYGLTKEANGLYE